MSLTGLLLAVGLALALFAGAARAQTLVQRQGDVYVFDNDHFRVEVDSAGGARIRSWVLKPSGREMIAMWKGPAEYGGALDDRATFTSVRYQAAVTEQGPQVGQVRFEVSNESGFKLVKIITARKGSSALEVGYEFDNGSQSPHKLFIRNFLLPGHRPRTTEHLYWINADPSRGREPALGRDRVSGYYAMAKPEYSALWDRATGDAILAYAPGADRFYFWLQAAEYPTFEWIYGSLAPGHRLTAGVVLIAVQGPMQPPDWQALVAHYAPGVPQATVTRMPGWEEDATRFRVSSAEKERGFWLSIGDGSARQRLPDPLPLDLPLDGGRCLGVTINALADFAAPVRVAVPRGWRGRIRASWQTASENRVEVLGPPPESWPFAAGTGQNLWLEVSALGKPAGEYTVPVRLLVGGAEAVMNLGIHVWPVRVNAAHPFHLYGYSSGIAAMAGGFEVTPRSLQRLERILRVYADMGGDVFDWTGGWQAIVTNTKIAGTGENLREVGETLDLNHLPHLDFSHYDPWFDAAKRHGVTMAQSYMVHPSSPSWRSALFDVALGKDRVKPGTPEGDKVIVWFYAETKRYLEARGFQGFFCKIQDEISPEEIPGYVETAKVVRMAGWRPFTTITGIVARTPGYINALNPYCDQWQLGFMSRDEFLCVLTTDYETTEQTFDLGGPWSPYTDGGAQKTWLVQVFGPQGVAHIAPESVKKLELLEDGRPLQLREGSPWGNNQRGVVIAGDSREHRLYVSPADGRDPAGHRYQLRLTVAQQSSRGKPLAAIKPGDDIWFYGGAENPYRGSYGDAWVYPQIALDGGYQGYAMWAFYCPMEQLVWINDATAHVTVSPPYLGYRDGWRDAQLFAQLLAARGRGAYDEIIGRGANASLCMGPATIEIYHFTSILNADDPLAINAARRRALAALAGR
jgi:hypothetical protein